LEVEAATNNAHILAATKKTDFKVLTFMQNKLFVEGKALEVSSKQNKKDSYIGLQYQVALKKNQTFKIEKYGGYKTLSSPDAPAQPSYATLLNNTDAFESLLKMQKEDWAKPNRLFASISSSSTRPILANTPIST